MSSLPIAVTPDTSVVEAARLMDRERVKRLAVVDAEDRVIGVFSRADVLKLFLRPDTAAICPTLTAARESRIMQARPRNCVRVLRFSRFRRTGRRRGSPPEAWPDALSAITHRTPATSPVCSACQASR
jgi:signal-transduction protein with cAMP-binding, CBS, and nucleotidyltransferase domain